MRRNKHAVDASDWRAIASLGEQLVSASSLTAQRDRIMALTGQMVRGNVDVWMHEDLFRLPGHSGPRLFPRKPRSEAMLRAFTQRKAHTRKPVRGSASRKAVAAMPIMDQGLVLGVLQVTRPAGPAFEPAELGLLESIAGVGAVGLYAALRVEVERFRLGQLNLVRQVSVQIATVLQLDELSRRVCELIQRTFNYYYVAIFTLRPGEERLRFRSSARSGSTGRNAGPLALDVSMGQGLIGSAASSGQVINVPEVQSDPRYRFLPPLPATKSEVAIPLKLEDQVLGVLDVQSDRPGAFHPNDVMLLEALADNVARAVESARLYGDVRRRADQLAFLADVSRSVTSTLELRQMMQNTAGLVRERFGYQHVSLFTVHPNRRLIEFEAGSGKRSPALEGYSVPLDDELGIIPWVARAGKTVLANDVSQDARYRSSPLPPRNTRSELAVPLVFGDRVLGVLDIQSERRNAFSENDQLMFEAVAGTIAASVRNADLYRSEQWRRQVADSLREVAGLLSRHVGVEEALQALLNELERNLPVDVSVIWLMDHRGLYVAAVHGAEPESIERALSTSPELQRVLVETMRFSRAVVRRPEDPMWPSGLAAGFSTDYSSIVAPMRVGDQPIGLIALAHRERGRYGHEASGIVETFANYGAVSIENSRLYDASQEQAYASAALLQVAQAVASPSRIEEVLEIVVRTLPILLGVSSAAVFGWDANRRCYVPRAQYGLDDAAKAELWSAEVEEGEFLLLDEARLQGEAIGCALQATADSRSWKTLRPEGQRDRGLVRGRRLLIAVPMVIKNDTLGVLLVAEGGGARKLRSRRLEIIQGVAQQIALAIQNDLLQSQTVLRERLETEVQLARQVQRTFIPEHLPSVAGWELSARWETARQVGGDFYDVLELPNARLGLFVADVADKGMPAALFMALTRTVFRAAVSESESPAEVLRRMNALLYPDSGQGMFVTAVYAVLDPGSGTLTYANAGHNPPLWIRPDGSAEKLNRTMIALGILDSPAVTEATISLGTRDCLLMYTDGLTEAFSPGGELFGEGHLLDSVRRGAGGSAEELISGIQFDLGAFVGAEGLTDDLTMLVVRRS
jgi:sigma-B regulation protein RsbU (phosphoserine phosphatase)